MTSDDLEKVFKGENIRGQDQFLIDEIRVNQLHLPMELHAVAQGGHAWGIEPGKEGCEVQAVLEAGMERGSGWDRGDDFFVEDHGADRGREAHGPPV